MSVTLKLQDIRTLLAMAEQYTIDGGDDEEYEFVVAHKREGELRDSDDNTASPAGIYMADVEAISEGWIRVCDGGTILDYRHLLMRYLLHVSLENGSSFVDNIVNGSGINSKVVFSRQDMDVLTRLESGALENHNLDAVKTRPTDVTRLEDMSPRGHMNLVLDGDGDVCISVKTGDQEGRITEWGHVEFCTGLGGGGSPRTYRALLNLMQAMDDDNQDPNRQHRAMK